VRHLPTGLDLQLVIEGRDVVLDDKALQLPANATGPSAARTLTALGTPTAATAPLASSTNSASASDFSSSDLKAQIAKNAPQILLLSDGDMNSFSLTMERASARRSVTLRSVSDGTLSTGDIVEARQ
jgi:hypothetical protein